MTKNVQIIYLNGPSSSGKTLLAKALQNELSQPFLHIGIDKIIGMMPAKFNDWNGGTALEGFSWKKSTDDHGNEVQELQVGPFARKICNSFKNVVLTVAKDGHHIIIDDVAFGKKEVDAWREVLRDFDVFYVGITTPLEVLEQREKERQNRIQGSARAQYYKCHKDVKYDLLLDTSTHHLHVWTL